MSAAENAVSSPSGHPERSLSLADRVRYVWADEVDRVRYLWTDHVGLIVTTTDARWRREREMFESGLEVGRQMADHGLEAHASPGTASRRARLGATKSYDEPLRGLHRPTPPCQGGEGLLLATFTGRA
jgi:hypothetical protein